jgi:hypothetical protein
MCLPVHSQWSPSGKHLQIETASVGAPLLTEAVSRRTRTRNQHSRDMAAARRKYRLAAGKFDPAPRDKHAADPSEAVQADMEVHSALFIGLIHTFPASDPVSALQPALPSRQSAPHESLMR